MGERPIIFTADVDERWDHDNQTDDYFAVLRIGQHEVARWPIGYGEREHLGDADRMEQFIAEKLAALFGATDG